MSSANDPARRSPNAGAKSGKPADFSATVLGGDGDPQQTVVPTRPARPAVDPGATVVPSKTVINAADAGATVVPSRGSSGNQATVVSGGGGGNAKTAVGGPSGKPADPNDLLALRGVTQLGNFKISRKLGQGGMGAVYLGEDSDLDRKAAIKILSEQFAAKEDFVKRFYREARSMAKVDHPNAVRVYAVAEDQGIHYVAMEFIDGKSVQDWLDRLGRLSVGDALHITLRACEALRQAHSLNLIHRDIKPDNIMLTARGAVKVADFGLAKAIDEDNSMTQSGTGLGTPYYMAPEQARNAKHVDGRADIYALGITLYHLLTGKQPFVGGSTMELLLNKEKGKYIPVDKVMTDDGQRLGIPEKLGLVIDKMIQVNPDARFKTFDDVIHMLSGLGLEGPSLSFIDAPNKVVQTAAGASGSARTAAAGGATMARTQMPAGAARPAAGDDAGRTAVTGATEGSWFVEFKNQQGKTQVGTFSTQKVLQAIRAGLIDNRAKAKKKVTDTFIPIAQFPEFEAAIRALIQKKQADEKGGDMKSFYAKIDRAERWRKTVRWIKGLFGNVLGFIWLLIYLAIFVAIGIAVYVFYPLAMRMITSQFKMIDESGQLKDRTQQVAPAEPGK